jgi:hypothetical protein
MTQGEGVKKGILSKPVGRKMTNNTCKGQTGLLSQLGNGIMRKNRSFQGSTVFSRRKVELYEKCTKTALFRATISFSHRKEILTGNWEIN